MAIVFIAPDPVMAETFKKLSAAFDEKIIVEEGLLYDAIPVARRYEEEADAIISRGGTVLVMREAGIATPIIEMQVTARDLAESLAKARELVKKDDFRIGVISFPNMTQQLRDFRQFFKLDISIYDISIDSDIEQVIRKALADGMDVLMGGVITARIAERCGVGSVLIESGETSFRYALEEAGKIAAARRLRDRRAEELRIVTENISEGVLAADATGNIFRMNRIARDLLGIPSTSPLPVPLSGMPGALGDILGSGRETRKMLNLGRKRVLVDSIPVKIGGSVASSVATLREVSSIQAMEEAIRREIYFKGYVAKFGFDDIVASDPATRRAIDLARRFAATNASILIRGESGVGKEVFAQSIHNASSRKDRAFVAMNCAAIPESLFESELFGYVDGAFTGARKKGKPGLFEIAHGGTVFLDEITEMPLALQARLLRVVQEHQVMRLGDDKIIPVDVRIIAASNRDIAAFVREGGFRNDLFWRLNVLNLTIPPLRGRPADILPLAERFLADSDICGQPIAIAEGCRDLLLRHSWPGNVRELRNFCERVAAICEGGLLDAELAMSLLDAEDAGRHHSARDQADPREDLRAIVQEAGGIAEAARRLGIHRTTLWRRLKADDRAAEMYASKR